MRLFPFRELIALIFIICITIFGCGKSISSLTDKNENHASNSGKNSIIINYKEGVVNGVKLRIPDYYLMHGIVYDGERRDGLGSASTATTQESKIDNFGILLRLSNLQPVQTVKDREDWQKSLAKPLFQQDWMMVSFDNHYPVFKDMRPYMSRMIPAWGPYVQDEKSPYGLVHYESTQSVDDGSQGFYGHAEYFFHDQTLTTIMCQTHRKKIPPFDTFDTCEHHFIISDLNLMAEAFYTKKDLNRWKDIESKVRAIARSFIM